MARVPALTSTRDAADPTAAARRGAGQRGSVSNDEAASATVAGEAAEAEAEQVRDPVGAHQMGAVARQVLPRAPPEIPEEVRGAVLAGPAVDAHWPVLREGETGGEGELVSAGVSELEAGKVAASRRSEARVERQKDDQSGDRSSRS